MKKHHINIIFFLSIILFSCFIYLLYNHSNDGLNRKETFEASDIEIVVARYNENLDWMTEAPFNKYNAIVYNKGSNSDFTKPSNIKRVVPLENVGREGHTILYHIVNNYDNLSEITVFLPGSCNMQTKKDKSTRLLEHIEKSGNAVFLSDDKHENIKNAMYDFTLDEWMSSDESNKSVNSEKTLDKSEIRPYGKWYESIFGDSVVNHVTYFGIFSISKQDILQHPLDYYKKIMVQLETSSNPEVGHYIERSWAAIFHPMTNTVIIG
jgi:hypothetical protein